MSVHEIPKPPAGGPEDEKCRERLREYLADPRPLVSIGIAFIREDGSCGTSLHVGRKDFGLLGAVEYLAARCIKTASLWPREGDGE